MGATSGMVRRGGVVRQLLLACLWVCSSCSDQIVVPQPSSSSADAPSPGSPRASPLLSSIKRVVYPPIKLFREAPPITRSWVSASVFLSILVNLRIVDARSICFSEREVLYRGEWWRLLTNFFYMGDQVVSIFFWMQIYHFWECLRVLELVKYHWEPSRFVKMIICSGAIMTVLKQFAPNLIFLGSPLVMVFMYLYSREYMDQIVNFWGFFQIRCGWLPFVQMIQDLIQAGDILRNILGLFAGHLYFYLTEVGTRIVVPENLPTVAEFLKYRDATPAKADAEEDAARAEAASEGSEGSGDDDAGGDDVEESDDVEEAQGDEEEQSDADLEADDAGGDDGAESE